jgi:hypothetical protein
MPNLARTDNALKRDSARSAADDAKREAALAAARTLHARAKAEVATRAPGRSRQY